MNNKGKGIRFEREVKEFLKERDFFVVRSAASLFPDLIAVKNGKVYAVECKVNGQISKNERFDLRELYDKFAIVPLIAYKDCERRISFEDLDNKIIYF